MSYEELCEEELHQCYLIYKIVLELHLDALEVQLYLVFI